MKVQQVLSEGKVDLVLLARQFLRELSWMRRAAKELGEDREFLWPRQYKRARQ